jgi:hypothetical protein
VPKQATPGLRLLPRATGPVVPACTDLALSDEPVITPAWITRCAYEVVQKRQDGDQGRPPPVILVIANRPNSLPRNVALPLKPSPAGSSKSTNPVKGGK